MIWEDQALCTGHETENYFDKYEEQKNIRKTVDDLCKSCPVNKQCFGTGISSLLWGVWGGVYLEEGVISKEFNDHKSKKDWQDVWESLTMDHDVYR